MNTAKPKYTSFIDFGNGEIAELIGDKTTKLFQIYNILSEEIRTADELEVMGQKYLPPKDDLVEKGTVLLPTHAEKFGQATDMAKLIQIFIHKYLDVSEYFEKLASYYVLLTWTYDSFEVLPYLRALGDYGTGKTRLQKVVGSVCYKPMFAGGATTPSPIFRIIDIYRGTLIIDEADFRFSDAAAEIIKIFNCGYTKGIPVLRTEGDRERIPVSYDVYGPKLIATRKRFEDPALESRCLTEIMTGNPRSNIPIHLPESFGEEALGIRNMLLMFRFQNYGKIRIDPSLIIPKVEPRINQIISPILSIIKDPIATQEIINFITGYAEQLKAERGEEIHAQVLRVMVGMVLRGETLRNKSIAEKINLGRDKNQGEYLVTPTKIGKINSSFFNLPTRQINGVTEILWDKEKARKLCDRYGIDLVDDVDLIDFPTEDRDTHPIQNDRISPLPLDTGAMSTWSTKSTDQLNILET